jgi:hypothetical protein
VKKKSVTVPLMFTLATIATTLPVFAGYVMSFCLLIWLLTNGRWRLALLGDRHLPPVGAPDHDLMQVIAAGIKPIHWGVLILVLCHLAAALLGYVWSPWVHPLGRTLSVWSHTATKVGLLWYVVSAATIAAVRLGWNPRRVAPYFLAWLVVQFCYCVLQHWTGVDWTHGWNAVLGSNRFAYGVYRVSGFMGHPLTFAYNHMVILLAACALAWRLQQRPEIQDRKLWIAVALVCLVTLLISGSRFVLLVLLGALLLCEGRRLSRLRYWLLGGGTVVAALLWLEGSVLARFSELFLQTTPLLERFPRLVFWRIHLQMFLDHPWFGVTMAGVDDALSTYYTAAGYHDNMYTAHNLVLQYLADTGIVGFVGLAAWFGGLLVARHRLMLLLGQAQGVGYLAASSFLCSLMQNNLRDSAYVYALWYFLSLLVVQSAVIYTSTQAAECDERKPTKNLQPRTDPSNPAAHL